MATSAEVVRAQLAIVTATAAAELSNAVAGVALERQAEAAMSAVGLLVPGYYDAAGSLAVAWYDEIRDESRPTTIYAPAIIGDPTTDWIEREAEKFAQSLEGDLESEMARMLDELARLTEKEVARGFRDTITGNTHQDEDAIGWSRVARTGACRFCLMLADKGAVYSEDTANFAAHTNCNCATRPEFENGDHGPEADVMQYVASLKRRTPAQQYLLKKYLYENYGGPAPTPLPEVTEAELRAAITEGQARNAPRIAALNDLLAGLSGN